MHKECSVSHDADDDIDIGNAGHDSHSWCAFQTLNVLNMDAG